MSVYEKFLDKNKSKLCESKSKKVSLKKLKRVNESDEIIDELKGFEADIMEYIYHKESAFKDAAEYTAKSNGYVYYNTRYGNEQAICINVKGRPKINVDIPDDMYEIAQDYIDTYISDLADSLHEEDKDFVIYGRSGGYWGYENFEEYIVISDKGYKVLKDKVIELMKDEDKADWSIYDIVVNHLEELGDLLDASHLTLSKDFLKKLEDLSSVIDTNETTKTLNYNNEKSSQYFLVQFDKGAKISYPVINSNNLSSLPNAEVIDFIWDGINWLCCIKSMEDNKTTFEYISFSPTISLFFFTSLVLIFLRRE